MAFSASAGRVDADMKAVGYAVLVHVMLLLLLVIAVRWPKAAPLPAIEARLVSEAPPRASERAAAQRANEEAARQREQERKKAEAREREQAIAAREREARDKAAREKKLADQKKAEEQKKVEERKKREQAEAKRREREDAEKRRKQAEADLKQQLAAEEGARQTAREQAAQQALFKQYEALISQKIVRNWVRPPSARAGMSCVVKVRLLPGGTVVSARVVRSCGSEIIDRSVENAVYKAAPLPLPEDKAQFEHFRELDLVFRPED
jgi:colicin import membrane protein